MTVGIYVGTTENDVTMEGLFDDDFTENKEYFRSDTLELGFKNEAQRIIQENKNTDGTYNINSILKIAFGHSYYTNTEKIIINVGDVQIISVAYES